MEFRDNFTITNTLEKNSSIINQLFDRIKSLEDNNKLVKSRIQAKANLLSQLEQELQDNETAKSQVNVNSSNNIEVSISANQINQNRALKLKAKLDKDLDIFNIDETKHELSLMKTESSKKRVIDTVKEVKIRFCPNEHYNKMYILGDFTKWEPVLMQKNKDTFYYDTILLRNYKYYYCFTVDNSFIVDYNNFFEANPVNYNENNYIDLAGENTTESSQLFDFRNFKALEEARKDYSTVCMNPKDFNLLNNLILCSNQVKEFTNDMVNLKEQEIKSCREYFNSKSALANSKENKEFVNTLTQICDMFKERVAYYNGAFYYVGSINITESRLYCINLYDENDAKVNIDYYIKKGFFLKFPLTSFINLNSSSKMDIDSGNENDTNNLNQNQIFSKQISEEMLRTYNTCGRKIKVFYQKLSEKEAQEQEEADKENLSLTTSIENAFIGKVFRDGFVYMKKTSRIRIEKLVLEEESEGKVESKELNKDAYVVDINDNMIVDVKYKESNLKVYYVIEEVKQAEKLISIKFWTSLAKKSLNIIHMHVLNEALFKRPTNFMNTETHLLEHNYLGFLTCKPTDVNDKLFDLIAQINNTTLSSNNNQSLIVFVRNFKIYRVFANNNINNNNNNDVSNSNSNLNLSETTDKDNLVKKYFTEIFFTEERYVINRFAKVNNCLDFELINSNCILESISFNDNFKVSDLSLKNETLMTSNNELSNNMNNVLGHCSEDETSQGLVSLTMIFDKYKSFVKENISFQLPICMVDLVPMAEEVRLQDIMLKERKKLSSSELDTLNKIYSDVLKFDLSKITLVEKEYVKTNEPKLNLISNYLQENELWLELDKLSNIISLFSEIKQK